MKALKKALTNIRRTPYQATAAILVLTITFLIGILISFLTLSLYQALKYFETRPQVLVFFENNTSETAVMALKDQLASNPQVSEITYIPQEEALNIYQKLTQNDPMLLELVTSDILPPSLEISTINIEALQDIANAATGAEGVEEVVYRKDLVDTLNKWLNGIKITGLAFISIMITTSILIVVVVVGMKISGKTYEVKVLRLIGASGWYIQGPYLVEGALYGIVSAVSAFALALSALLYSSPLILEFAGEVPLLPNSIQTFLLILGCSVVVGVLIGALGSFIAIKRFLKL